jgi:hypothetical protein
MTPKELQDLHIDDNNPDWAAFRTDYQRPAHSQSLSARVAQQYFDAATRSTCEIIRQQQEVNES